MNNSKKFITSLLAALLVSTPLGFASAEEITTSPATNQENPVHQDELINSGTVTQPFSHITPQPIRLMDLRGRTYDFDTARVFTFIQGPLGENLLRMDEIVFNQVLDEISKVFEVVGNDASIKISNTGELLSLTQENQGVLINRAKIKNDLIMKTRNQDYSDYQMSYLLGEAPSKTKKELQKINYLLGEFQTSFNTSVEGRTGNISLGAKYINGRVLMPGEEFSFLQAAGPLSLSNGYTAAKVIVDGEFVDGIAGGACQVSTTMFNAVLRSGLQITSRRNHSLPIAYVPRGTDAAVATGLDFKFKNNNPNPVYIQAYVNGNKMVTKIYGAEADAKTVKLSVVNTGERQYTLTRDTDGVKDVFRSSYREPKIKTTR